MYDEVQYYLPNDVNEIVATFTTASIKCIHLNTRSVKNKMVCLEELLTEFSFQFSVIMLTETWSTSESDIFRLPNYNTYYLNRSHSRGGGVALLIADDVECQILHSYTVLSPDYEMLSLCTGKHVFSVCYRPPTGDIPAFIKFYDEFLAYVVQNHNSKTCWWRFQH